ncbi:MAG: 50S ribosomal protein L10 [bacterium]|nr:50S ribosomal protein L10 [bacterium]
MRLVHQQKAEKVELLRRKIQASKGILLTDYRGITVFEITELRKKLRECGAEYRIFKNNQILRATAVDGVSPLKNFLTGTTAVIIGHKDIVAPINILLAFMKEAKKLEIKAGMLGDGKALTGNDIKKIASLPNKEVLLAQMIGAIQSPLTGLARVLSAPMRDLACVLKAIGEKKG